VGISSLSLAAAALALACLALPAAAQSNPTVPALRSSPVPPLGGAPAQPQRQPSTAPGAATGAAPGAAAVVPSRPGVRPSAPGVPRGAVQRRSEERGIGRHELLNPEVLDYFYAHRHEFSGFSLRELRINGVRKFLVVLRRK